MGNITYYINKIRETKETILNLRESGINIIPDEIKELTWLETLSLSFNSIINIDVLSNLPNLKKNDLRGNNIEDINVLRHFKKLEWLDLDNNRIKKIDAIGELHNLETLFLSNNKIEEIPNISKLQKLSHLDLSNNKIVDISPISDLNSLVKLGLNCNSILSVENIINNTNLQSINIYKNRISNIKGINSLSKLKTFIIGSNKISDLSPIYDFLRKNPTIISSSNYDENPANNPLTIPPPEIVSQGAKSMIKYFEEIDKQGADILYEAKMLIVGEGGAGKTSLLCKIKDINAELPKGDETTFGIDISRLSLMKMKGGKTFFLNIWDFGGQEIYHSTHQFFLTNRSLYILLDDTRKDDKDVHDSVFSYWLQVVELLGGNSPLIIVQNEKGDRSKEIDLCSIQSRYTFVKDCKQTNLLSGRGVDNVLDAVCYWSKNLSHIGETLPIQWIKIRQNIEKLSYQKINHISIRDYLKICADNKIPEEKRALNLSSYLHDLGVFLHYQDDKILKNTVILNNSWATGAVYKILDDEEIKSQKGFFKENDLNRIWASEEYKYEHPTLIALMEKFELCYKISKEMMYSSWLAPQLLPISQPKNLSWSYENNLKIKYVYDFMPKGLLSRLIVRLNRYLKNFDFAWRNGVILERMLTKAFITEAYDRGRRGLWINVKGTEPKEFLTIISEELDELNSTYKQIKVEKLIQCNCTKCIESTNPIFYDFEEDIQVRILRGKTTIECKNSYEDIDIKSLINGIFKKVLRKKNTDMKVFISYSHKDENFKDELLSHLKGLKLTTDIAIWDDRNIVAGEKWDETISKNLRETDIILLLISSDFIASIIFGKKNYHLLLNVMKTAKRLLFQFLLGNVILQICLL